MTPIDPNDLSQATYTAMEYVEVYGRLWPIAATGGVVGVAFNSRKILHSKTRRAAIIIVASEWFVGASAAMLMALTVPAIIDMLPFQVVWTPGAELGFFGFVGGSAGRSAFRWVQRRVLPISGNEK